MWTRSAVIDQRRVIAIDAKTIRGARRRHDPDQGTPHLVAELDHHAGAVLGQVVVGASEFRQTRKLEGTPMAHTAAAVAGWPARVKRTACGAIPKTL